MVFKPFNERIQIAVISDASLASCHYLFKEFLLRVSFSPYPRFARGRVPSFSILFNFQGPIRCLSVRGSLFIILRKVAFVKPFFEVFLRRHPFELAAPGGVQDSIIHTCTPFVNGFFKKIKKFFALSSKRKKLRWFVYLFSPSSSVRKRASNFRSRREIWTCVTPSRRAVSLCVLFLKKR